MSLYVDASAFLKRYLQEADSGDCVARMQADPVWVAAAHTAVEVRRNLARQLTGAARRTAHHEFATDWGDVDVVALDEPTCEEAAQIAETTGCRTLDALHLAAAMRVGGPPAVTLLTYDLRQAKVARTLGLTVVGA